jgi:hypothetical protein
VRETPRESLDEPGAVPASQRSQGLDAPASAWLMVCRADDALACAAATRTDASDSKRFHFALGLPQLLLSSEMIAIAKLNHRESFSTLRCRICSTSIEDLHR